MQFRHPMYPSALALALACAPLAAGAAPSAKTGRAAIHHAAASHPDSAARGYLIEPAPAWVVPAAEAPDAAVEAAPMHYRLIDEQVRAEGRGKTSYLHVVRQVNDTAGLARGSQIQVQFDPSFQTLVLHQLDVVRNGRRLSQLHRKFPLLQRETQLERQMYDGRVTLSIVLDDVRAGDRIEYAYSVRGSNPVFDGKFVHQTWIGAEAAPVALYQVRLLAPLGRDIHYSAPGKDVKVASRELGSWRETVFRRESVTPLRPEAGTPPSAFLDQRLEFSEFADWAEVARWGQALFAQNGSGPLLDQEVAQVKAQATTPAEQVRAALEFVQQQVRYFGTEIGTNTHRPTSPDKVIAQRFGDCKDKVTLLAALLQRLGLQATPVLVNTALRGSVDRLLPSPLDFDHVIARVELDGATYYLDGTRNEQSGTLAHRQSTGLGKGLPLAADTQALAALPSGADNPRMTVKDTIVFSRIADDPTLESRITYHGELAEALRATLAARGSDAVARQLASTYLKVYPKARAAGAMQVEQSSDDDAVSFVQHFNLPGFWRFPEERALVGDEVAWGIAQALAYPKSESRKAPYLIELPGVYRHTVTVKLPEDVFAQPPAQHFEDGDSHLSLRVDQRGSKRESVFDAELHLQGGEVRPDEWAAYMGKLASLEHHLQNVIVVPSISKEQQEVAVQALKASAEQLRRDPHKYVTETQRQSTLKLVQLDAQIAGGRLPADVKAQALTDRGSAYDNLGRYTEAQADFVQALQIDPDNRDALNAAAINAFNQGQFDRAETLTGKVLAQDPRQSEALNARALSRYFHGDLAGARSDWQQMLGDSAAVRRGYPLIWLALDLRNAKQDVAPLSSSYAADDLPAEWPRPLVDYALGKTTPDAVIDAAKAAKNPTESLCEAYFYIGERYRADGDLAQARKYWQKSRDQGVVEFIEDVGSRLRLAQMQLAQK